MRGRLERWMTVGSAALVLAALLACKKKDEAPAPVASASAEPVASAAPSAAAVDAGADVKRYGVQEVVEGGTVKIIGDHVPVYAEASTAAPRKTDLVRGTLVNLKASYQGYMLIEYPSGPAELSLGWVVSKGNLSEERLPTPDAGTVVHDAGVAIPDAGAPAIPTHDAGAPAIPTAPHPVVPARDGGTPPVHVIHH
jgi:hypothetical protein